MYPIEINYVFVTGIIHVLHNGAQTDVIVEVRFWKISFRIFIRIIAKLVNLFACYQVFGGVESFFTLLFLNSFSISLLNGVEFFPFNPISAWAVHTAIHDDGGSGQKCPAHLLSVSNIQWNWTLLWMIITTIESQTFVVISGSIFSWCQQNFTL